MLTEVGVLALLLATTAAGGVQALTGRARMRAIDLLGNIQDAGPSALLIVSVVNFLIGAILAFVGAVQLRKFAADIYVANLVGLALVREMAAVMTAIIMAGRTGGAYAARIATMQGNEEIDALQVIGIPVSDYIVLPSILALVFTMPFLYLYGCLVGMMGGFVVSDRHARTSPAPAICIRRWLRCRSISSSFGFVKSIAFAVMIGVTSCQHRPQGRTQRRRCGHGGDAGGRHGHRRRHRTGRGLRRSGRRGRPVSRPHLPGTSEDTLLSVRGVTLAFGPKVIQHDLSFDVRRGSIFAVMGGSGCGKSTVLKSMIGLLRPAAGSILVENEDYWAGTEARRTAIGRRFGVLFQSGALWSALTVGENVALPLRMFTRLSTTPPSAAWCG